MHEVLVNRLGGLSPPRIWLVGCFGFNGPSRQYFSLYRAVSQREGERGEKGQMRVKMSKQPPPVPTASAVGSCPTVIQIVGRPGTGRLPSTIAPPDHPCPPRKSVVRLTVRPDMTLDVYRGRKTTTQLFNQKDKTSRPFCAIVGQGPTVLAVGAGGGCLDIFSFTYHFSLLSPPLWETARYRLKYGLKGP